MEVNFHLITWGGESKKALIADLAEYTATGELNIRKGGEKITKFHNNKVGIRGCFSFPHDD